MQRARLLALAAVLCACARSAAPPNLLVVTLDTVRADHLGAYGYGRPTSPAFDGFAAGAAFYTRAFATSPWTLPSHASLFTGLYPIEHGAHSFLSTQPRNAHPLDRRHATLAAELTAAGYDTAAIAANVAYLDRWTGLDRGFSHYDVVKARSAELNARVFAWLDAPRNGPFFLFVNYMDAHRPYDRAPVARLEPADPDARLLDRLIETVLGGGDPPPPDLVARVIAQYDHGVAHDDDALGALLAGLAARGLAANTVVVVTSDHGEYFGEHDLVEHSKDVYQAALWIPLAIRGVSGAAPQRIEAPVSLAHLPQLIARELGARAAPLAARFPRAPGQGPLLAENYFTRAKDLGDPRWAARFRRVRRAVFDWPWKRIVSSDGGGELYDLAADPREQTDLAREHPDVSGRLDAWLAAQLARVPERERGLAGPEPTPSERDALRELGYAE